MINKKQNHRILVFAVFTMCFSSALMAADRYSVRDGLWKNSNTWSASSGGAGGATPPVAGDVVYIESNHTIRVNSDEACSNITFTGNGAELRMLANRALSVSGTITLNKQSASNTACSITGTGNIYCLSIEVGSAANSPGGLFSNYSHSINSSVSNITVSGNLNINSYWSFLINLRQGIFNLESGTLTIGGQIRALNATGFNSSTFSMAAGSGDGMLVLQGADPIDMDPAADVINLNGTASTVDYARAGTQPVFLTDYHHMTFSGSGVKTISAGGTTVYGTMSMEGTATHGGQTPAYGPDASLQYKGSGSQSTGTEFPATFSGTGGVIIDNSNGVALDGNRSIDYLLTFVNGLISTGANILSLAAGGNVAGAGGTSYVLGNFEKGIGTATASKTFEIGDASGYTPVVMAFSGSTNGTGSILAYTTPGDHPQLASSLFSASSTVNRYWTLSNNGVTGFTGYDATFTFLPGDADAGTDPNIFVIGSYEAFTWSYPTVGIRTATSTQASGLSSFGDFQIGQIGSAYRSAASGAWELAATWEKYVSGSWIPSTDTPSSAGDGIVILSSHTVSTSTTLTVDEFTIASGGTLLLGSNMTVADGAGTDFMVNGTLDCGGANTLSGPGSFFLNYTGSLFVGSPDGISASAASGNIQTSSRYFDIDANYAYNGSAAQITGDGLPATLTNLSIDNASGVSLTASASINGTLTLSDGALIVGANSLTFQNSDTPIARTAGTLSTGAATDLYFGTAGNTGGAAFVIPDGTFTSPAVIYNLTIHRDNDLTLNDQVLSVYGTLLCNGPLNTAGNLTLLSDASGTALVDGSGTGTITGAVTMQRYLPVAFGYKYFSSPFQAATVAEFGEEVDLTYWFPNFYRYDESRTSSGWVAYNDPAGILEPMMGYSANFGSAGSPDTVNVSGELNNGPMSVTLYNNNNTYTQGINLVGNPYPSAIDWDAVSGWTRTNIDNAIYYFNASATDQYGGTYSSYVNGISSDGVASNVIPSMQGFLVHVSDGAYPVSATLGVDNPVRINDRTQYFAKSTSSMKNTGVPLLRMGIVFKDDSLSMDPFVVYVDEEASPGFDPELDAKKLLNTDFNVPNLYSILPGGEQLSISAIPVILQEWTVIPLGLKTNREGALVFSLTEIDAYFSKHELFFHDKLTGIREKLNTGFTYEVQLAAGTYNERFYIEMQDLTVGTGEQAVPEEAFSAYAARGVIRARVIRMDGNMGLLKLYGLDGRMVFGEEIRERGDYEFAAPPQQGIYILQYRSGEHVSAIKLFIGN